MHPADLSTVGADGKVHTGAHHGGVQVPKDERGWPGCA